MYKYIVTGIMSRSIIFMMYADPTYLYGQLEGFIA